jgi:hypothetical protein
MRVGEINIWIWSVLFILYLTIDILNIRYLICVQKLRPLSGSLYSFVLCILTSIGTICFVENPLNVIPIACGLFVGTYGTLLYEKKKDEKIY